MLIMPVSKVNYAYLSQDTKKHKHLMFMGKSSSEITEKSVNILTRFKNAIKVIKKWLEPNVKIIERRGVYGERIITKLNTWTNMPIEEIYYGKNNVVRRTNTYNKSGGRIIQLFDENGNKGKVFIQDENGNIKR